MKNNYKVIGLMSGTSLDGLDIAYCLFSKDGDQWVYSLEKAVTLKYSAAWMKKLSEAPLLSGVALIKLDADFGSYLGKACYDFIKKNQLTVDFISSHGHTIFHQPEKGFTYQLGNGNAIHVITGLPVVYDFRSLDVLLGGQGAPLVPVGDKFLFHDYDVCLNLGGIANLSHDIKKGRTAFDICFCNMSLNYLMEKKGKQFDKGGALASSGEVDKAMLRRLTKVYDKFRKNRPSLGREIFEKYIKSILDDKKIPFENRLRTCVESTAIEIVNAINLKDNPSILCTGGGAFNTFLVTRMLHHCADSATLIIPEEEVIKFKEALVFAFLGVLRVTDQINCLQSVTHAKRDSSSGVLVGF